MSGKGKEMKTKRLPSRIIRPIGVLVFMMLLWLLSIGNPEIGYAQSDNGFTYPTDGTVVNGIVEVSGRAFEPKFRRVEIYLLLSGNIKDRTFVGLRGSQTDGRITAFDSRRYPDGEHTLLMRVVRRDFNYIEYMVNFTIRNAGVTTVDNNGITSIRPIDDITVTGPVRINGIANDPLFWKWQIDLLRDKDPNRTMLMAKGERPVLVSGILAPVVDTTQFPDGAHQLRLRVFRRDGSYTDYVTDLVIDNTRKRTQAGNGILSPEAGEKLSCDVRVLGVADHPQFVKWQLDIVPVTDANMDHFLSWSEIPLPRRGQMAVLNTRAYTDGDYQLRLRVVRADYNYTEYFALITVANQGASCDQDDKTEN
jgi:hypothetical protein